MSIPKLKTDSADGAAHCAGSAGDVAAGSALISFASMNFSAV
jgi:hypothetical protein